LSTEAIIGQPADKAQSSPGEERDADTNIEAMPLALIQGTVA